MNNCKDTRNAMQQEAQGTMASSNNRKTDLTLWEVKGHVQKNSPKAKEERRWSNLGKMGRECGDKGKRRW